MLSEVAADLAVHLAHCNQGDYAGSCKYGEPDCPCLGGAIGTATGPHTSRSAPETSLEAAGKIAGHLGSIRARVLRYADRAGPAGFIDEELIALVADPKIGDRSVRPRRTELTDENWIVDSGRRRPNRDGNNCVIWVHRNHAINPPPLIERAKAGAADPLKAEARAMAATLARYAESLKLEGRLIHKEIGRAGELLAALSRP